MELFLIVAGVLLFALLVFFFRRKLSEYRIFIKKVADMLGEKDVPPLYLFERLKSTSTI